MQRANTENKYSKECGQVVTYKLIMTSLRSKGPQLLYMYYIKTDITKNILILQLYYNE